MDNLETELEALERVFSDTNAEPIKLSYGLLRSVTDDFSNEVGHGGFGFVYMGYLGNGKVAVKKLSNPHALPEKQFLDEITCLKMARHKNIVRFLGYCSETQGELFKFNGKDIMAEVQKKLLCFEYVPNGNIQQYLKKVMQDKLRGDDWPVRYQMIRGICEGLHYLHDKHITHLDLKPENVMLDAHMEPKVTDFGLSRYLDQGQSKMITQHVLGTPRYIAPEIIDKGEISFKSDMYALGIIIIELLTGIHKISLENWDESLDMDCPRVRRCTKIARNCTDPDKQNRPAIDEVISDLDELETMIPLSSVNQVYPAAFSGTELVDVYPLELSVPFVANQEMHCHLSVTNKTDGNIYCVIVPEVPCRYRWGGYKGFLPPMFTTAITLHVEAEEELLSYTDKLEILVLITGSDEDVIKQQMSKLFLDKDTSCEDKFRSAQELLGGEVHRALLTASVVVAEPDNYQVLVADTTGEEDETKIDSIDVHPSEPWVLIVEECIVYIMNWQTRKIMGVYKTDVQWLYGEVLAGYMVAKFIARKQWVVIGSLNGSILVRTCPTMDHYKEFKAHNDGITSLAVHPTRPFLLSLSYPLSLKLWDWNRNWSCAGLFDITVPGIQVMFNPKHTSMFASLHEDGTVVVWRIGHPNPIDTTQALKDYETTDFFTFIGDRHFIATIMSRKAHIWDLRKGKNVHTLYIEENYGSIVAVVCHPTRPILVTVSDDRSIRVWDSTSYRLKKAYENLPDCDPIHVGFTGSRRLVIGYIEGIAIMDIDLE